VKAAFLLQYLTELMLHGDIGNNTTVSVIESDGTAHGEEREIYEQDFDPERNRVELYPVLRSTTEKTDVSP